MPSPLCLRCPAKINLHLRVGPRRGDGFHSLLSWMTTVGLFDTLVFQDAPAGGAAAPPLSLECDAPDLPCDERNLVVRVAAALAAEGGAGVRPLRAVLGKRVPMGAGLGGGSSDAARALLGLNRLWAAGRDASDLSALAARFGSDLPFFLFGPSSVCGGRGEVVRPIAAPRARWAVLVLPAIHLPTADVYRRFDDLGLGREADVTDAPDWAAWAGLAADDLLARLVNDLEPAAFSLRPALADLRAAAGRALGRVVRMSGSGSSLFTLYDAEPDAREGAARVARDFAVRTEAVEVAPRVDDDLRDDLPAEDEKSDKL